MRHRLVFIWFVFSLLLTSQVFAVSVEHEFRKANVYYKNENYEEALAAYSTLINEEGYESAEVYYNSGNCYIKLDDLGRAVLAYKRAHLLMPRNKMIRENLGFARQMVSAKVEDERNWYMRTADFVMSYISMAEAWSMFFGILFLFLAITIVRIMGKGKKGIKRFQNILLLFLLLSIVVIVLKSVILPTTREAVVLEEESLVRYGPSETDKVAFRLVPGIEVELRLKQNDWYKIRLSNGSEGWIRATSIGLVNG